VVIAPTQQLFARRLVTDGIDREELLDKPPVGQLAALTIASAGTRYPFTTFSSSTEPFSVRTGSLIRKSRGSVFAFHTTYNQNVSR
jgi:hypothetical protein